jgi:Rap1 GTPase-GDP dissociation stimulator 1
VYCQLYVSIRLTVGYPFLSNTLVDNAVQLTTSRANASPTSPTGVDQILALVKRSDTVAVKSEGARVIVNVVKSLCAQTLTDEKKLEKRRKAIELVTASTSATALAELVGRSRKYPVLISEGMLALTLLSLQPSGCMSFLNFMSRG